MPISVLVNGAKGKMGKEIVKNFAHDPEFFLAGATDSEDDLVSAVQTSGAKIVIDFTKAGAGFQNAHLIIQAGAHPVIGTTGFMPDQIAELQKRCAKKKLGGVIAPNFSIGGILMMRFAAQAAKYFAHAEIIEMHHNTKEETPSGTALRTAELIAQARSQSFPLKKYTEILPHARGANAQETAVHSVRLPGLVAHQIAIFAEHGEILTLKHDCLHRQSFMPGIKFACKKALALEELIYGLENLL